MAAADRTETWTRILEDLASDDDVSGCALVSHDGLLLASALTAEEEESIGEATAMLLEHAVLVVRGLALGSWTELSIRGDAGHVVFVRADATAALLLIAPHTSSLPIAALRARRAVDALMSQSPLYP